MKTTKYYQFGDEDDKKQKKPTLKILYKPVESSSQNLSLLKIGQNEALLAPLGKFSNPKDQEI